VASEVPGLLAARISQTVGSIRFSPGAAAVHRNFGSSLVAGRSYRLVGGCSQSSLHPPTFFCLQYVCSPLNTPWVSLIDGAHGCYSDCQNSVPKPHSKSRPRTPTFDGNIFMATAIKICSASHHLRPDIGRCR